MIACTVVAAVFASSYSGRPLSLHSVWLLHPHVLLFLEAVAVVVAVRQHSSSL